MVVFIAYFDFFILLKLIVFIYIIFKIVFTGGIPYGSVSGMLGTQMLRHTADYYPQNKMMNDQEMMSNYEMDEDENQGHEESMPQAEISPMSTMFILPNMRAPNFDKRSQGPVQIYKFPAVVGPNKVAMVTGMAF